MKSNVCVDFDGVLNNYTGWNGEDDLSTPREGAREFLQTLHEEYTVVIFTARDKDKVKEWLELYDLPFDSVTNIKEGAVAYIDDRAIRFDGDYSKCLSELYSFEPHWVEQDSNKCGADFELELYNFCREYVRLYELKLNLFDMGLFDEYRDKLDYESGVVEDCLLEQLTSKEY